MKKTVVIIVISVVLTVLLALACIIVNAIFGNPISRLVSKEVAKDYVAENYPAKGYEVEDVSYSFKDSCYHAYVSSEQYIDGDFTVYLNAFGKIQRDDYEYRVNEHGNVSNRLFSEYKAKADTVLESEDFPYDCHIAYGDLDFDGEVGEEFPENAIRRDELVNGAEYDIDELGRRNGRIVLYINTDKADIENASEIMLDVKQRLDTAGVSFYWIDLTLRIHDGDGVAKTELSIRNFKYDDIYEDGLNERVAVAKARTEAYFAEKDAEKATEKPIE